MRTAAFLPLGRLGRQTDLLRDGGQLGACRWCVASAYVGAALLIFAASHALDGPAYRMFLGVETEQAWWHRGLKLLGYAPLWLGVAIVLLGIDWYRRDTIGIKNAVARATLLALATGLGGLFAETLKLVLRRLRPSVDAGAYVIRPYWEQPLSSGNVGLPSSHALVAFAALMMLGRLFPRFAPLCWAAAIGCGATRVIAGAHYVSDVVLAALVAWPTVEMLWWWNKREVVRHDLLHWPAPVRRQLQRRDQIEASNPRLEPQEHRPERPARADRQPSSPQRPQKVST